MNKAPFSTALLLTAVFGSTLSGCAVTGGYAGPDISFQNPYSYPSRTPQNAPLSGRYNAAGERPLRYRPQEKYAALPGAPCPGQDAPILHFVRQNIAFQRCPKTNKAYKLGIDQSGLYVAETYDLLNKRAARHYHSAITRADKTEKRLADRESRRVQRAFKDRQGRYDGPVRTTLKDLANTLGLGNRVLRQLNRTAREIGHLRH